MTEKNNQEQEAEEAQKIHTQLKDNESVRRNLLAINASLLAKIKEKNLYKIILGDSEAEWAGYLSLPEIYYTRNESYNLIRLYEKFEVKHEMPLYKIFEMGIPTSRLVDMLPVDFVDTEDMLNILYHAKNDLPRDWQIIIRERKGLKTAENCEHKFNNYEICCMCGEKHKI